MSILGEKCLELGVDKLAVTREMAGREMNAPENGLAGLNAELVYTLGEYRCGHLEHPYSRALMEFKDNKHGFGRGADGRRRHLDFFARCLSAAVLGAPGLGAYNLIALVPPKLNQSPGDYHLYDLARAVEAVIAASDRSGSLFLQRDLLSFRSAVPPLKSVELSCREEVIHRGILCREDLAGRAVILLDDIIASGATARECVRALREAGAAAVAVVALARRAG